MKPEPPATEECSNAGHHGLAQTGFRLSPNNQLSIPSLFLITLHLEQSPDLQVLQTGSGMWKCLTAVK